MASRAGYYNAVIRDDLKILGRTLLTDPKQVPWWWEVRDWQGKDIVTVQQLEEPFDPRKELQVEPINLEKPLQIRKRKPVREISAQMVEASQAEFEVIFPLKDTPIEVRLKVKGYNTLQDLRWMVSREYGVAGREPNLWGLVLGETKLWNKVRWTMDELGASPQNNRFRYLPRSQMPVNVMADRTNGNGDMQVMYRLPRDVGVAILGVGMWTFERVEHLKQIIWDQRGIPVKEQRLSYGGVPMTKEQDHLTFEQLDKGRVTCDETVYNFLFRLEKNETPCQEVRSERINFTTGQPASPEDHWRAYAPGMNLKGACTNAKCKSWKQRTAKDSVIVPMGFSNCRVFVLMAAWRIVHECPACGKDTFKPSSYLISGARCAFQYKLPGDRLLKPWNTATDAPFPKCLVIQDPKEMKKFEHTGIRVTPWDQSPHDCVWCDLPVGKLEEEVSSGCGHFWHRRCSLGVSCAICEAALVKEANLKDVCK